MTTFWKLRVSTLVWGFLVIYAFTQKIDFTSQVLLVQVIGNSVLMWWFTR